MFSFPAGGLAALSFFTDFGIMAKTMLTATAARSENAKPYVYLKQAWAQRAKDEDEERGHECWVGELRERRRGLWPGDGDE